MRQVTLFFITLVHISYLTAQVGVLDSTFSDDGMVVIGFGRGDANAYSSALQADGKVVIAGGMKSSPMTEAFAMARFNPDGAPDDSFGLHGRVVSVIGRHWDYASAIVIQPDSKIVLAGSALGYFYDLAIARYNPDGTKDRTFGIGGATVINGPDVEQLNGVALQPDGKIVAVGNAMMRVHPNGSMDSSFGDNGFVMKGASAVAIQPDGKIVVGGNVMRYYPDGSRDSSFQWKPKGTGSGTNSLLIQPDGKILVVGTKNSKFTLARGNPDGSADSTFGTAGDVVDNIWGYPCGARAVTLQQDGKIIAGGWASAGSGSWFALACYNVDGSPDHSFGISGQMATQVGPGSASANAVHVLADGRILLTGTYERPGNPPRPDFCAAAYLPDGTLDSSFGTNGIVMSEFWFEDRTHAVTIQPNWRVVGAGSSDFALAVARVNLHGGPDDAFGFGLSKVSTHIASSAFAHAVKWMPNGDILTVGQADAGVPCFMLVRYTTSGKLAYDFAGLLHGILITRIGDAAGAYDVTLQPDGKIVAAGFATSGDDDDFALARYSGKGFIDNSFGSQGKVIASVASGNDGARSVAVQPDGKIVAAGYARGGFAVARFNPNGSLDNTFDGDGKVITPIAGRDTGHSMVLQPDNKIVVAGTAADHIALVRYTTAGALDHTFGSGGIVLISVGVKSCAYALAQQPDGKLVIAGYTNNGSDDDFLVARYLSDGSMDTSFAPGGYVVTPIGQNDDIARAVAITPDGKIVATGYTDHGSDYDFAIARYISGLDLGVVEFIKTPDPLSSRDLFVYPNPIRDHAMLEYTLTEDEFISIHLFDLQGRIVTTFVEGEFQQAGQQQQSIYLPEELPSGMNVIVLSSSKGSVSVRVVK